jgi:hypothetical protein
VQRPLWLLVLAVAVGFAAAVPAQGAPAKSKQLRITVQGGKPVGGIQRFTVAKNEVVALVVSSDVEDEVHLHGYDKMKDVTPQKWAWLWLKAGITGVFEIELESRGLQIGELTVKYPPSGFWHTGSAGFGTFPSRSPTSSWVRASCS